MKGLFIPDITAEMFRGGCLESIEQLMAEGEIYDIDYPLEQEPILCKECENYYLADNRIPEQQCYVCDYWGEDNPEPTGYCNHAVRKVRG